MPTTSGWAMSVAAVLLAGVAYLTAYPQLFALTGGTVALLLAGYLSRPRYRSQVSAAGRTVRLVPGRPMEVPVRVANPGARASAPAQVVARLSRTDGWAGVVQADHDGLAPRESRTIGLVLDGLRRGVYQVAELTTRSFDLLGLFRFDRVAPGRVEVLVHPRTVDLAGGRNRDAVTARGSRPSHDLGDVFHTLRPYGTGDDVRLIHWMATARTGEPVVRDLAPPLSCAAIVLDTRPSVYPDDVFESAVEVAASLALASATVGNGWFLTTSGCRQRFSVGVSAEVVLDRLASVTSGEGAPVMPRDATEVTVVTGPRTDGPRWRALAGARDLTVVTVCGTAEPPSGRRGERGIRVVPVAGLDDLKDRLRAGRR
jgi:uncharacterized protein (DUF58 family)